MAERTTTGHANMLLAAWAAAYAYGVLTIPGTQPDSSEDTEVGHGTLLAIITDDGLPFTGGINTNGILFGTPSGGVLGLDASMTLTGLGLAAGVLGWYRFYANTYTKGASTSALRFDGRIGNDSNAELPMVNLTVGVDIPIFINAISIPMPLV